MDSFKYSSNAELILCALKHIKEVQVACDGSVMGSEEFQKLQDVTTRFLEFLVHPRLFPTLLYNHFKELEVAMFDFHLHLVGLLSTNSDDLRDASTRLLGQINIFEKNIDPSHDAKIYERVISSLTILGLDGNRRDLALLNLTEKVNDLKALFNYTLDFHTHTVLETMSTAELLIVSSYRNSLLRSLEMFFELKAS